MTIRDQLTSLWPLFGLHLTTPRLQLRLSAGEDLAELAALGRTVQPSGQPRFLMSWMYGPSPAMERQLLQQYWRSHADCRPNDWHLRFVVYQDNQPVGMQDIWAQNFAGTRAVTTGSWLGGSYQGQGLGTEMRAAVLELAFAGLGAQEAHTDYYDGNHRSAAVSRKLGYIANGQRLTDRDGAPVTKYYLRLDRSAWERHRQPGITITGLEPCREMLIKDKKEPF